MKKQCIICDREFEAKRIDSTCCSVKCWHKKDRLKHKEVIKIRDRKYKDVVRHGGKREILLDGQKVYQCSKCGKTGNGFQIVAHHITFDKNNHDEQEILCRACHARIHFLVNNPRRKNISREQIEEVITKYDFLDDMCDALGVTRSYLYKLRKKYALPSRTELRGRHIRKVGNEITQKSPAK